MKSSIKLSLLILAVIFTSCSKDGTDGAIGPKGENGSDGVNGIDGVDGNANVTTYFFNEPEWGSGEPLMRLDMSGVLTTEVVSNDVILVYLRRSFTNSERVFQIPGWVHGRFPDFPTEMITPFFTDTEGGAGAFQIPEQVYIIARTIDDQTLTSGKGIPLSWIRVVIIKSANTITGKYNHNTSTKESVMNELKIAGVNVNDYHAVCKHYGIAPN